MINSRCVVMKTARSSSALTSLTRTPSSIRPANASRPPISVRSIGRDGTGVPVFTFTLPDRPVRLAQMGC